MDVRRAAADDEDAVVAVLATAFAGDPVWGWAVPEAAARVDFWRFFVQNGIALDAVWVTPQVEATAVWVAPGVIELDDDGEAALEQLCHDLLGAGAPRVMDALGTLDAVHPTEPHHYLSLLGTHDEHRGQGLGMALLREGLRRIDALGEAAYLESTNPANLPRYASVGFEVRDQITIPGGGQLVTTMWRDPRP